MQFKLNARARVQCTWCHRSSPTEDGRHDSGKHERWNGDRCMASGRRDPLELQGRGIDVVGDGVCTMGPRRHSATSLGARWLLAVYRQEDPTYPLMVRSQPAGATRPRTISPLLLRDEELVAGKLEPLPHRPDMHSFERKRAWQDRLQVPMVRKMRAADMSWSRIRRISPLTEASRSSRSWLNAASARVQHTFLQDSPCRGGV